MKALSRWLAAKPSRIIYLLVHTVLFVGGFAVAQASFRYAEAIGTGLIASGVVGYVLFVYVVLTDNASSQIALISTYGITQAFDSRAARIRKEYDERLAKAHDQIDVMGFGLRALREDYLAQFTEWSRRAAVRILLLDPDFPTPTGAYADQRDSEEHNPVQAIRQDVQAFVSQTQNIVAGNYRFSIRLYQCLPSINMFRIDDEVFWGPYLIEQQSRNMPTFVVRRGGLLFERLTEHFDKVWKNHATAPD